MKAKQKSPSEQIDHLRALLEGTYIPPQRPTVDPETVDLFGGLAGVRLHGSEVYEIAPGVELRSTYAHIFSYFMGAFSRPTKLHQPHPAPWQALKGGGAAFDVETEIYLRSDARLGDMTRLGSLWLVTALIRLLSGAPIHMPALSSASYADIPRSDEEAVIWTVETRPPDGRWQVRADEGFVKGVRDCAAKAAQLAADPQFHRAFQTFDAAPWLTSQAARMIAIWAAMETAMRPGSHQITKRLARGLGDYIGTTRSERDRICNDVIRLYQARGSATHDAQDTTEKSVRESYLLARSMFIQIIATGAMPPPRTP